MKAIDVLKKTEAAGFQVSADERDIILDGDIALDDALRQNIQSNKQELLWLLRTREYARLRTQATELASWMDTSDASIRERARKIPEFEELIERIAELQEYIDRYRESGLDHWYGEGWLLIHSELLNEMLVVVHDASIQLPKGCRGYPIYEFKEVQLLDGASDKVIRQAHAVKKVFDGTIVESKKQKSKGSVS